MTTREESLFKNVPIELMEQLMLYRTKKSVHGLTWKNRQPKPGQHFGFGGSLRREHARSASLYLVGEPEDVRQLRRDFWPAKIDAENAHRLNADLMGQLDRMTVQIEQQRQLAESKLAEMQKDLDKCRKWGHTWIVAHDQLKAGWGCRLQTKLASIFHWLFEEGGTP